MDIPLHAPGPSLAQYPYWRSFEEHEKSHADQLFNAKFPALLELCSDTRELGYDMLWQGESETRVVVEHSAAHSS